MKRLFLAAEMVHPDSIRKLRDFIGGSFNNNVIAYIPTASNGKLFGSWKDGDEIKEVYNLGAKVHVVELESYEHKDIYKYLRDANIIWVAGGMVGYLLYWIRRAGLDTKLPELLNLGKIYVGSSAGSMACSKTQKVAEWFIGEEEKGAQYLPGLDLIDFEIYPHYEENLLDQINNNWNDGDGTLRLLKNGDVITVEDEKITVLGSDASIIK